MALKNKAPITPLGFEVQFCKKLTPNMKNKKEKDDFKIKRLFFYGIQKFNSRFWVRNIIWS